MTVLRTTWIATPRQVSSSDFFVRSATCADRRRSFLRSSLHLHEVTERRSSRADLADLGDGPRHGPPFAQGWFRARPRRFPIACCRTRPAGLPPEAQPDPSMTITRSDDWMRVPSARSRSMRVNRPTVVRLFVPPETGLFVTGSKLADTARQDDGSPELRQHLRRGVGHVGIERPRVPPRSRRACRAGPAGFPQP